MTIIIMMIEAVLVSLAGCLPGLLSSDGLRVVWIMISFLLAWFCSLCWSDAEETSFVFIAIMFIIAVLLVKPSDIHALSVRLFGNEWVITLIAIAFEALMWLQALVKEKKQTQW